MDKRFLEDCLAEGMSLEAIGEVVGKHPSTVGYWLKKHGLSACNAIRHAPRGKLSEAELKALVEDGLTLREIAERLDRSVATVRHWLGRYGLATAGRRRPRPDGDPKRAEMSSAPRSHHIRSRGARLLPVRPLQIGRSVQTSSHRQAHPYR